MLQAIRVPKKIAMKALVRADIARLTITIVVAAIILLHLTYVLQVLPT